LRNSSYFLYGNTSLSPFPPSRLCVSMVGPSPRMVLCAPTRRFQMQCAELIQTGNVRVCHVSDAPPYCGSPPPLDTHTTTRSNPTTRRSILGCVADDVMCWLMSFFTSTTTKPLFLQYEFELPTHMLQCLPNLPPLPFPMSVPFDLSFPFITSNTTSSLSALMGRSFGSGTPLQHARA
jgi:hypothetical protein